TYNAPSRPAWKRVSYRHLDSRTRPAGALQTASRAGRQNRRRDWRGPGEYRATRRRDSTSTLGTKLSLLDRGGTLRDLPLNGRRPTSTGQPRNGRNAQLRIRD